MGHASNSEWSRPARRAERQRAVRRLAELPGERGLRIRRAVVTTDHPIQVALRAIGEALVSLRKPDCKLVVVWPSPLGEGGYPARAASSRGSKHREARLCRADSPQHRVGPREGTPSLAP